MDAAKWFQVLLHKNESCYNELYNSTWDSQATGSPTWQHSNTLCVYGEVFGADMTFKVNMEKPQSKGTRWNAENYH